MQDDVTPDGCSVELYARIPALGEAEILHGRLGGNGPVLDLGSGTGRIAVPLARLGYQVVAVDESGAMLARVPTDPRIRVVCSRIQDLRLEQRFAGVLLAANLINTELDDLRGSMLTSCARHLALGGLVLVPWRPPDWFRPGHHSQALGGIDVTRQETDLGGDLFGISAQYREGDRRWQHDYVARRLTTADIYRVLDDASLTFDDWISEDHTWFSARRR